MLGGSGSPGGDDLLTVTVERDEHGYGMKVSGDNPVYVQSVKEHGAAWRAGLRAGDRILLVDGVPVHKHQHQQVVHMIRANTATSLTVHQNTSRHKTPITAPLPVNSEKQRQLEVSKVHTVRLMLDQELKYIRDLRNELSKVPDVRKQAQLESSEQRCSILQHEIDTIMASQPAVEATSPTTPKLPKRHSEKQPSPPSFLSGLPRSLSNLTGQSLRSLRQRQRNIEPPLLIRQNSDESAAKRRQNNIVPLVPVTCLDNGTPPPLPPRSSERPKRTPMSPPLTPINPLAKPKPCSSISNVSPSRYYRGSSYKSPMVQSMPGYEDKPAHLRRSSHSLDGELDGPQPNSIAMQMSYPLVNVPPPPLQTDNRSSVPVLHVRSQSSPEHLDHGITSLSSNEPTSPPPPGTPPPPYQHNTQPCADPQRAIISMEDDDSPSSDNSTYSSLFMNLRTVRESKARMAVLLNWLLGERRCACSCLVLILTDGFVSGGGGVAGAGAASTPALRRWAYEIHSTFTMPNAVLQLNGVDENMANEIEHVLVNEYEKEEILRNVFRKARQKAKEELAALLTEFQVKRQVGLGTLYGPDDATLHRCTADKQQEQVVVERILCGQLRTLAAAGGAGGAGPAGGGGGGGGDTRAALLAAVIAAALQLQCRPASVAAAVGGSKASFLQRDKLYKQRVKQLNKQHPQPFVVRGHHLQLQALTSVAHCHHCDHVIWGLAPQAYVCSDCLLRVHRACARSVEEGCCLDQEHHNNRISRFMERIHQANNQDSSDKKSRKASGTAHFLNMERSFRKMEDDPTEQNLSPSLDRRDESDESLYESADCHSDVISASDDALPRLSNSPTMSKESLKLAITDEEIDVSKVKKGHRKTMSLSNPLEMVRNLGDEWFEKKDVDKNCDKKKSRESLWSEEDKESFHGSTINLENSRKNSKKENKSQSNSRKSSTTEAPKSRKTSKTSSVSALNLFRRRKTPTSTKPVEVLAEAVDNIISTDEILNYTKLFLEEEKRHATVCDERPKVTEVETDTEDDIPSPKVLEEQRRRLSRQTSRTKSKARGKSQSVKVNTLRKSHSGTLKKQKKKGVKTPLVSRSRQASIVDATPLPKKKNSDAPKHNSWLFSGSKGETRREGSNEEPSAPDADLDLCDATNKELSDNNWRITPSSGRGVNRAESCRERDAPRRGKHRNASDPNRLTAHNHHHDLEPGAATAPSGSSSSSSLSSRSNESNTVAAEQQPSQSDLSEEEEALAAQWADSLPPNVLESLSLTPKLRKRQEVIHELIVSEGSHVRWLKVLHVVFLRPLEAAGLLGDELRALFPNLPCVRERHARLLELLRAARDQHVVPVRAVAGAVLATLGDSGYAPCLSRFCSGQRLALEALRERRRKHKELHHFLQHKEQHPLCGRLQLPDLLACVWQRLTKYQLLLEGILKTCGPEEEEADVARLQRALQVAKDVLNCVDTAIKTAENEHRLRYIQSRLEVRGASGGEWEELRRLDLPSHRLRVEGELAIRNDSNKKILVLALMLEDYLVLLQREGDKFILKPITQPSQHGLLSPLIKWDKVLFRPNAAVKNTFFLMNINGVQMHELSTNTAAEYSTWVKHIQESPLAKLTELKPNITPSHQHSRSTDDSGINVSRNPSDASEKSSASTVAADDECERDKEKEDDKPPLETEKSVDKEELTEREEKHTPRRPTVGRISVHGAPAPPPLVPPAAPAPAPLVLSATPVSTDYERLNRLEAAISRLLQAKRGVVGRLLGAPPQHLTQLEELAVAEATLLAKSDAALASLPADTTPRAEPPPPAGDLHHLLLAAHAQANQLTELINSALHVDESAALARRMRARSGRCDNCSRSTSNPPEASAPPLPAGPEPALHPEPSFDMLTELDDSAHLDSMARWHSTLSALCSTSLGLRGSLSALLARVPPPAHRAHLLDAAHAHNHRTLCDTSEEISSDKENEDITLQEQPSNGG